MYCVSIAQSSQRMAQVDMFNAAAQADFVELRLDKFEKAPDFKELLGARRKPIVVSCRRQADGGDWTGSEENRLALLRAAVVAGADYIEVEHDCAAQVRRYGATKRVIAYTNTREVPADLDGIHRQCLAGDPDVVKLTMPTRTPEEAWPLIRIVAGATAPTVTPGWGRGGRMLAVLGRRYKAPWTYAALERGMEAYPGMPTIAELNDVFDLPAVGSKTPLLGVAGALPRQQAFARLLNHGFRLADSKIRSLPLDIGDVPLFRKVVDAIRLCGLAVDDAHQHAILAALHEQEDAVRDAGACDFVAISGDKWKGFAALPRALRGAFDQAFRERRADDGIAGKAFLVVGSSAFARSVAADLRRKGLAVTLADGANERARKLAEELGVRYIPNGQVYSAQTDALILTADAEAREPGTPAMPVPPSVARAGLAIADLSALPNETPLLEEARARGGLPIPTAEVVLRTVQLILKALVGKSIPLEHLKKPLLETED